MQVDQHFAPILEANGSSMGKIRKEVNGCGGKKLR